jgi:hypothetical protein
MKETVPDFLSNLSASTREITLGLREVVRGIMPEAHEFIYHHALTYATSESSNDRFCYVAPFTSHVNLGFMFGKDLEDPARLLEGEGKRLRHVKVRDQEAVRNPEFRRFLQAAWADAPKALEEMKAGQRRK